jgi:hypothetical protein
MFIAQYATTRKGWPLLKVRQVPARVDPQTYLAAARMKEGPRKCSMLVEGDAPKTWIEALGAEDAD